ncbi:MAG: GMC family oxidoreductase [Bacteroidota bacterium]
MQDTNTFDAIVVGSGISGGWAAKELCEKGLKTLVLERGRSLEHITGYPTASLPPWSFDHRGRQTQEDIEKHPVQSRVYAFNEGTRHLWINDNDYPYTTPEDKPFLWIRGNHVGGRSIMWGRQCYRWSDLDFEANAKDGKGIDWPIRYKDIAPWYDYVERFAGISGQAEGIPHLPDGQFLPPFELNCMEEQIKKRIEAKWSDRKVTNARIANLTKDHNGRGQCQRRNLCYRGCPYGAYFSSQSSTLPAAAATGNMTLRPDSAVAKVIYDEKLDKATGVLVVDTNTGEQTEYFAKVIFLCASTLGSTRILLNSATERFSEGLANSSDSLGRYLMDHQYRVGASCSFEGMEDQNTYGSGPGGIYIPRFRNIKEQRPDYLRGFGYQGRASRSGWQRGGNEAGVGADFKASLTEPGPWSIGLTGFGECLPYAENKVSLNKEKLDKDGLPSLFIDGKFRENEDAMRVDIMNSAAEMLEAAGGKNVQAYDRKESYVLGFGIHEMGTARMGNDPKTSVLNKWNQCHDVKNLFVTDGSCMTSSSCVNPSITYMALTARAVDHAVKELNKQNL